MNHVIQTELFIRKKTLWHMTQYQTFTKRRSNHRQFPLSTHNIAQLHMIAIKYIKLMFIEETKEIYMFYIMQS